ncbi:MAG: 3-keto-5-aminohexanoate cleavage protein [Methylobacteriaceae bacterium]|jgi:3-keto-5-aminohexanoate cleavage enzyme|nr:3-keto-5-aminohexanoate cleavage protein [Methylobacteriaceae bacterium]
MSKIILTAASTGNKWKKSDNPNIPYTVQEIIDDGVEAFKAGASMLHIHARDDDGTPTFNPDKFAQIIDAYKSQCPGAVIQMSVGGMQGQTQKYLEPLLKLRPDVASFNLTEPEEDTRYMEEMFAKYGVKPVIECFSFDMLRQVHAMLAAGKLKTPLFIEVLFELKDEGRDFAAISNQLFEYSRWIPEGAVWSQTRGGSSHIKLQAITSAVGGHIRTGLEDCIRRLDGEYVKSSAELIAQAAVIAEKMGRSVATGAEAKQILSL